ncbi:serine hydrolase domain-containing protein [Cytobacillus sp. IB215665]|uniref:serine hydrolase domain-containing protein n=1 Tax=Cytobacillus sp. IB215665 TaxID=3097357 RepID=UPI002A10915E|nr:serine hydrolase domain-containing protein [Cytobacillus sp. IB215665]MDX8363921.1 serine hydrolase domain-containing protein [Cytobacillus sp. IB215665]
MKKRIIVIFLIIFIFFSAMNNVEAKSAINNIDFEQLEEYIEQEMNKHKVPGMAFVLIANEEPVYMNGFGSQKIGSDIKVDGQTNFGLASVSKSMTALAVTQLAEQGLLDVDATVVEYLPWFISQNQELSKQVTIRHLLQHSSGIPTTSYGLEIEDSSNNGLERQVKRISEIKLVFVPGESFEYSNFNYWTLGLIIEKVSGMNYHEAMNKLVFQPLGMERTGFYTKVSKLNNLSVGHRLEAGKNKPFDYAPPYPTVASGGIYSNVEDVGRYITTLLQEGQYKGRQVIPSEAVSELFMEPFSISDNERYGYGWEISQEENTKVIDHGGDYPNFTADVYLFPEYSLGFALLSNSQNDVTHSISENIKNYILGDKLEQAASWKEDEYQLAKVILLVATGLLGLITFFVLSLVWRFRNFKLVFTRKINRIKIIFQLILIPIIFIGAATVGVYFPIFMIGSYRIAVLYAPDLVYSIIVLSSALLLIGLLFIISAFIRSTKYIHHEKGKVIVTK